MTQIMARGYPLLKGIRIVDLSRLLPGPYCSMLLADMGAEVIKVEEPGQGDLTRQIFPGVFSRANHNKRSLTLNLKHEAAREVLYRICATADAVVESFRPGVAERLKVGFADIKRVNPGIIYCSISGYGQTGPYRARPGHDINYLGVAGALTVSGSGDGPPALGSGMLVADLSSGSFGTMAILAALVARKSGALQDAVHVDVSMTDVLTHWMFQVLAEREDRPDMTKDELMHRAAYDVFQTRDGRSITLGCTEDWFWQRLAACLGLSVPGTEDWAARNTQRHEVNRLVRERLCEHDYEHWAALFAEHDIPFGPVNDLDSVFQDPLIRERKVLVGEKGQWDVSVPFLIQGVPEEAIRPAPGLGVHTDSILADIGYAPADIERLRRDGAI